MKDSNLRPPDKEKANAPNIINSLNALRLKNAAGFDKKVAPFAPYLHPDQIPERTPISDLPPTD